MERTETGRKATIAQLAYSVKKVMEADMSGEKEKVLPILCIARYYLDKAIGKEKELLHENGIHFDEEGYMAHLAKKFRSYDEIRERREK